MSLINKDANLYTANITSKTPMLLVFMLDLSASMSDELVYEGVKQTKAELVSRIMNLSFNEIINYCKKIDSYKDYFNIMTFGYSEDNVVSLLKVNNSDKSYVTINEMLSIDANIKTYDSIRKNINGMSHIFQTSLKEYIKPMSSGKTPTGKTMNVVIREVEKWLRSNSKEGVAAPIVINITDGEFTDITKDEFLVLSQRLKSLGTQDGNLLFFNVHIASADNVKSDVFPSSLDELNTENKHAHTLFEASSVLPERFSRDISLLKGEEDQNMCYKAFSFNSSINELLKILNIGSLSVKRN